MPRTHRRPVVTAPDPDTDVAWTDVELGALLVGIVRGNYRDDDTPPDATEESREVELVGIKVDHHANCAICKRVSA